MDWSDVLTVLGAIGGIATVSGAVAAFVGNLVSSRIIQAHKAKLDERLESHKDTLAREADRNRLLLKRQELMFEREYSAAAEFFRFHRKITPEPWAPGLDWSDAQVRIAERLGLHEKELRIFLDMHSASQSKEARDLIESAISKANEGSFEVAQETDEGDYEPGCYPSDRVPKRLRSFFDGRTLWKEALGTGDPEEAKVRFASANARFEARLKIAREQAGSDGEPLTAERAEVIATSFLLGDRISPSSAETAKARTMFTLAKVSGQVMDEHRAKLENLEIRGPQDRRPLPFPDPVDVIQADIAKGDFARAQPFLEEVRAFAGLSDATSKRDDRLLAEALLAKLAEPEVHKERAVSIAAELQHLLPSASHKDGTISEAFAYWKTMRTKARAQTVGEFGVAVKRFIAMFGDLPANEITDDHAEAFKNAHLVLPSPLTKAEKERPFGEIVVHFSRHGRGDRPGLSPASVKKYVGAISAILKVCKKPFKLAGNPFAGVEVPNQKNGKVQPSILRRPFTTEMLWTIFASPMFTGCAGKQDYKRRLPGENIYKDELYWIFILAAATGAASKSWARCSLAMCVPRTT